MTLYVCQHERDMKQLFAWMAKNKPIESNTQELFDSSDPWNNATQDIRDDTDLLKGRINLNKATLGRNDEYLLTNSLLRNNALVMTLGGKGRATKGLTKHHRQDGPQAEITLNSKSFYDNFLPECHDIFNKIKAEEIANAELPYYRQNNWLLEPLVVRLMADCYGQIKCRPRCPRGIHQLDERGPERSEERHSEPGTDRPGEKPALPSEQGRLDTGCQPDHQGRDRLRTAVTRNLLEPLTTTLETVRHRLTQHQQVLSENKTRTRRSLIGDDAIIVSQDADLAPAVAVAREIAQGQNRRVDFESAFPQLPGRRHFGIPDTTWVPIDKATYDTCLDLSDYRAPKS